MEPKRTQRTPDIQAREQHVLLSMKHYNLTRVEAEELVDKALNKLSKTKPIVKFYHRGDNKDKFEQEVPINEYLDKVLKSDLIMAPTWTTYLPRSEAESPEADIVEEKMANRTIFKKRAHKALLVNDMEEYDFSQTSQVGEKTVSNSISGAISVGGTALQNPSSHSTLTSTARITTSTANHAIERLVSGSMHFKDPNSTFGYIASILEMLSCEETAKKFQDTISHHNLAYCTVQDVMDMIVRNSEMYWSHTPVLNSIRKLLESLSQFELTVILYNGSLHYIKEKNKKYLLDIVKSMHCKRQGPKPTSNDVEDFKALGEIVNNTLAHIFSKEVIGLGTEYDKYPPQLLSNMLHTGRRFVKLSEDIGDIVHTFIETPILSPNVADYKAMVRDSVIVNDTDSGIFHIGYWIKDLMGSDNIVNDESRAYCGVMAWFCDKAYSHAIEVLTTNMNVADPKEKLIEMKSEYTFSMLALPSGSKHYLGDVSIIEGNVLPESKLEQKGVGFRNSNTPQMIRQINVDLQKDMAASIKKTGKIDEHAYLSIVISVEKILLRSMESNADFYRSIMIKNADAYKDPNPKKNNTKWISFWNRSFGKTHPIKTPVLAIKVPVKLTNKTKLNYWVDNMGDASAKGAIRDWLIEFKKTTLPTLYIPKEYILETGIPEDIIPVLDSKRVILDIVNMLYMTLETLGIYKDSDVMYSEIYTLEELK